MQGTQHRLASCFLSSLRSHGLTGRLYSSGNKMISCGLLFVAAVARRTGATHNFMEPWCQKERGASLLPRFPLTGAVQANLTATEQPPALLSRTCRESSDMRSMDVAKDRGEFI